MFKEFRSRYTRYPVSQTPPGAIFPRFEFEVGGECCGGDVRGGFAMKDVFSHRGHREHGG